MRKNLLMVMMLSAGMVCGFSQKIFNMEDVFRSPDMYPQSIRQLQFIPHTDSYVYAEGNTLYKVEVPSMKKTVMLGMVQMDAMMNMAGEQSMKRLPGIEYWENENEFYFQSGMKLFACNISEKKVSALCEMPEEAENVEWNYAAKRVAYTIDNNLMVCCFGEDARQINPSGEKEVKYGHVVHRNEFGIEHGCFWSPKGDKLAFYRMDESMVTDYPLVDVTSRIATVNNIKYPMAGMTSHQVTLGVYDCATGNIVYMKTGEPADQFLCSVTWSPDQKHIYIAILNREQNHMKMSKFDAATGDLVKVLFEEQNARYVEPSDPLYFLPDQSGQFLWMSQKSGYKHLHLYTSEGKEVKQLTKGNWVVMSFLGFDQSGKKVIITSNKDELVGERAFVVDIKSGKIQNICTEDGVHRVQYTSDAKYFIDRYSSLHIPAVVKLKDAKGKTLSVLLYDTTSLKEFALPEVSIGMLRNANGDSLYYRLIKPINFDADKKYPVFFYVYGGPHSQLVTDSWMSGGHFLHYMAQKGYVVFTLDNRGTANRGFEFESTIHRRLGVVEVEDQMLGVEFLKSLPYVDTNRFSIDGWSYGGFMTLTLKLQHPEVFKVATAGGPVIDWKYYEVMYGERYMDTPQENPEGYEKSSLLNQVDKIDGHILIFHGCVDPTVVWQNSLQFLQESMKHRKLVDYYVYPTHEHNVMGLDRLHLWQKIEDYHATFNK
ncbi:MAG: DPP IV N-terminal domain-containing protein [Bacteroidales bacterium]|nr:DPP IV N-terminal domain-containing protein [Bacteroidales bacterium]